MALKKAEINYKWFVNHSIQIALREELNLLKPMSNK